MDLSRSRLPGAQCLPHFDYPVRIQWVLDPAILNHVFGISTKLAIRSTANPSSLTGYKDLNFSGIQMMRGLWSPLANKYRLLFISSPPWPEQRATIYFLPYPVHHRLTTFSFIRYIPAINVIHATKIIIRFTPVAEKITCLLQVIRIFMYQVMWNGISDSQGMCHHWQGIHACDPFAPLCRTYRCIGITIRIPESLFSQGINFRCICKLISVTAHPGNIVAFACQPEDIGSFIFFRCTGCNPNASRKEQTKENQCFFIPVKRWDTFYLYYISSGSKPGPGYQDKGLSRQNRITSMKKFSWNFRKLNII